LRITPLVSTINSRHNTAKPHNMLASLIMVAWLKTSDEINGHHNKTFYQYLALQFTKHYHIDQPV
jgi:hypothetical protein